MVVVVVLLLLVVSEESVSVLILAPQSLLTVAIVGFVDLLGETNSEEEMTTHLDIDIDIDIAAATVTATTAATLEAHGNIILQTLV